MREIKFRQWSSIKRRMVEGPAIVKDGHWRGPESVSFESDPLMQFTGLHDKNGREIYEGDILHLDKYTDWVVTFYNAGFKAYNVTLTEVYFPLVESEREVIGNIYENPELVP